MDYNDFVTKYAGNLKSAYTKLRDQVWHRMQRMGNYMSKDTDLYRRLAGILDNGKVPTWKQAGSTGARNRAISQMIKFLSAKSTTKKGYTEVVNNRTKALEGKFEGYGANKERASEAVEKLIYSGLLNRFIDSKMLDSNQVLKMWAMADDDDPRINDVVKALEDFESGTITGKEAQEIMSEAYREIEEGRLLQ